MVKLIVPAPQGWQSRGWEGSHKGIDYGFYNANPEGTKNIVAAAPGTVESVYNGGGHNQGWGNRVIINHGGGVKTAYNHFRNSTIAVRPGQQVGAGTYLGKMGSTGLSTGPHLHFELYINGDRVNPAPYFTRDLPGVVGSPASLPSGPLAADQRRAIATCRRRADATTQSAHVGGGSTDLLKGAVGNFIGWKPGESVEGNNVWFKGTSGDWFWSGGFEGGANTAGLPNLTPAAPAPAPAVDPTQRVAIATCRRRSAPTSTSTHVDGGARDLIKGAIANFVGWGRGESVEGNDVWFKGTSGDWFWSGGFEGGANTAGLPEVATDTQPVPTTPAPGTSLDPAAPWKRQTPDSSLATWVGSPNYNYREATKKDHITLHWMAGTLAGTDSTFQNPGTVVNGRGTNQSTTYGVGLTEIHQYVKEADYSHSDGDAKSNASTISIEHEGGYTRDGKVVPVSKQTMDLSAKLVADIAKRQGWKKLIWMENVFPHSHFASTACPGLDQPGGVDPAYIIAQANAILGKVTPTPEQPKPEQPKPDESNDSDTVQVERSWLVELLAKLASLLK